MSELLPVHGFVLAGGKSSRMGTDKALLELNRRPLVEIALETLRAVCARVSIVGNREDLEAFAPVVLETRLEAGPGSGIEAGLGAAEFAWAMFLPVDTPLMSAELLRTWAEECLRLGEGEERLLASYLEVGGQKQPAQCLVRQEFLPEITRQMDAGETRLAAILSAALYGNSGGFRAMDAKTVAPAGTSAAMLERWFYNVNTPHEFEVAEAWERE